MPRRSLLIGGLPLAALLVGLVLWRVWQPVPAATEGLGKPDGLVAAASGLLVTYDGTQAGLTIGVQTDDDGWYELMRLEPRAQVSGVWTGSLRARPAAPTVEERPDSVVVHLNDLQIGEAVHSSWSLILSRTAPTLTLERVDTLLQPQAVTATGLALISAPNAVHERLVLVNGTAYTLRNPIERLGNHGLSGIVTREPAFTFTASVPGLARAVGQRLDDRDLVLLITDRSGDGVATIETTAYLHTGLYAPLQGVSSSYNPGLESFLLAAGYFGNVFVSERNGKVLTASMVNYPDSVWIRDVAGALRGYSLVLDDMSIFRNVLVHFLQRTSAEGVVPEYFNEAGRTENRQAWDAMPDLIHAVYAYVAKTRDVRLLHEHMATLHRVMAWMRALDADDDGLPDRDVYPYGYFDSVENGVMHTYAIASFYAAHLEMAELLELVGQDGGSYRAYAERMRAAFNRPVSHGGYWQPQRGYPIAWKKADGRMVEEFETFGVLAAVRSGLISDEQRLITIGRLLRERREEFTHAGGFPTRLMLGGYDRSYVRPGVLAENLWLLDASAPWLIGLDVAVRARLGATDDAAHMLSLYEAAAAQYPPMPEFAAGVTARHGPGESRDGGRLWDNSAWFDAVYSTHYGLRMTPKALVIQPYPLYRSPEDIAHNIVYQGSRFRLTLQGDGYTLTVLDGPSQVVTLRPIGRFRTLTVNGGPRQPAQTVTVQLGQTYEVRCFGAAL